MSLSSGCAHEQFEIYIYYYTDLQQVPAELKINEHQWLSLSVYDCVTTLHLHFCTADESIFLCLLKPFWDRWSGRGGHFSKHHSCIIQDTLFINGERSQRRLKSLARTPKLHRLNIWWLNNWSMLTSPHPLKIPLFSAVYKVKALPMLRRTPTDVPGVLSCVMSGGGGYVWGNIPHNILLGNSVTSCELDDNFWEILQRRRFDDRTMEKLWLYTAVKMYCTIKYIL